MPASPLPLAILAVATTATALPPADCAGLIMATSTDVTYRSRPAFPDPAKTVSLRFFSRDAPVGRTTLCGYTFTPDPARKNLTITTARFASFTKIFPDGYRDTGVLALDLVYANEALGTPVRSAVLYDPKTARVTYRSAQSPTTPSTVGVSVDGGPVQPLFYNWTSTPVVVPKQARTVDIYVKPGQNTIALWHRVSLDLRQPTVTFYKQAAFPVVK